MRWTNEELELCINLIKSGKTYSEISKVVNRTPKSVKVKLNNNGFRYVDYKISSKEIIKCLFCGKEFEGLINDRRKFCSNSCSASYNNPKNKKIKRCLYCNSILKNNRSTYCDNRCQFDYMQKKYIENWKNDNDEKHENKGRISNYIRNYLFKKYNNKCSKCGWGEINPHTGKIPLEVEHIDGNHKNNKEENLTLLCPNCHSLTSTYKGANKGNGRHNRMERYHNRKSY